MSLVTLLLLVVVALFCYEMPFVFGVILFVFVVAIYVMSKKRGQKREEPRLDNFFKEFGTPDEQVVTDPLRSNEVTGSILCYTGLGFWVINGQVIRLSEIVSLNLKNVENPYLPCDYKIHIETKRDDVPNIFVSVGADINWASDVIRQLEMLRCNVKPSGSTTCTELPEKTE